MISGIFHKGSGLGNQLHRYIAVRCLALEKNYDWGMVAAENFKGSSFMHIDIGNSIFAYHTEMPAGKVVCDMGIPLWEEKTNYYNPELNFIEDETIIDGEFQDERYFERYMREIDEWLMVEPLEIPDNVCVIGFRGREYYSDPNLGLPREYYEQAIIEILKINPQMIFEIHTDDPNLAERVFAGIFYNPKIVYDMEINWRSVRYAKYAIIANSSFYILPRLLNKGLTIAPRYWARRNIGEWSMPQNYYRQFTYI